jgi:murein DD-endopeptidase MepM/ murein hydrolase activator NlpD
MALIMAIVAGSVAPSAGQSPAQIQDEYQAAVAAEIAVRRDYDAAVARQFQLAAEVQSLEASIAFVQVELDEAQAQFAAAEVAAIEAEARLDDTTRRLAEEQRRFRAQVVAAYVDGGSAPLSNLSAALKDVGELDALAKGQVYASAVVTDRKEVVERYLSLRDEVEQVAAETELRRAETKGARDLVAAKVAELDGQRQAKQLSQLQAAQVAADAERLFGELEFRRRAYELRYAELTTQSDSIREILAVRQRGQQPLPSTYGIFLNPIKNGVVVSGYGMRRHPILDVDKMHVGLDLDGPAGAPMRASADGFVVLADERGGYGLTVVIDHGSQLATLYGHMSSFSVRPGDFVRRGDTIGTVGSTGLSTGPHCHWEVRVLGVPVDATPYLSTAPE